MPNVLADALLRRGWEPVEPMDFYRDLFPLGALDEDGEFNKKQYTGVALEMVRGKAAKDDATKPKRGYAKRYTITDDLDIIDYLLDSENFVVIPPISYAGKSSAARNARYLFALGVDLDNLKTSGKGRKLRQTGLDALIAQWSGDKPWIPRPTYVVASGNGLHLYYFFRDPVRLWPAVAESFARYKHTLTWMIWNRHTTKDFEKPQYESLFQGFRMVGGATKSGDRTVAFAVPGPDGEPSAQRVTPDYLNSFLLDQHKGDAIEVAKVWPNPSGLTRAQAAEKWPDWYQRRVVEGQPKGHWTCNRRLYDWWLRRIKAEAAVGHRYHCVMMLAVYALKCDIPWDELQKDALELQPILDARTDNKDNPFTRQDVQDALKAYHNKELVTYPRASIAYRSGLVIEPTRRNGRKRAAHLRMARLALEIKSEEAGHALQGRHDKAQQVAEWRQAHPDGRKADCAKDTGMDPKTVRKWWI